MKSHTSILTVAAATLLSGSIVLLGQNTPQNGIRGTTNDPTPASNQPVQSGQPNQPAGMADHANQGAMEANRVMMSDLHQFAQDPKTAPDKLFVLNAYCDSSLEIKFSQQALTKTDNDQVKTLANQMVTDHTKLNQQLQQWAQQNNVELPQGIPEAKQAEMDVLQALPTKEYNQQYLAMMNADHAKAIACFRFAAANAMNPQVKQVAADTVPVLEHHRELVRQTASAAGVTLGDNEAAPAGAHMEGATGGQGMPMR